MAALASPSPPLGHAPSFSIFQKGNSEDHPIHQVPLRVLNRPFVPELDEAKVKQFMDDMKNGDDFTAIEVLKVVAPPKGTFYFSFGGCHRYEAAKRLGLEYIPGRIIQVPPSTLKLYLGAGCPF